MCVSSQQGNEVINKRTSEKNEIKYFQSGINDQHGKKWNSRTALISWVRNSVIKSKGY